MADPAVVSIVKARLSASITGLSILDTINARPPLPSDVERKFVSIEHNHADVQRITLGQPAQYREAGGIYVVCQTAAGKGTAVANTLAETVRGLFFEYALDHFRVLAAKSALVFENDDGNFFTLKVPVEYEFDFFKP